MALAGPSNFSEDAQAVIDRPQPAHSVKHDNIEQVYEIQRCVDIITSRDFRKVALQFPDELLADSAAVAELLTQRTSAQIFVLADTSYGSCCVDQVAARHVSADFIIHFGRSCLSSVSESPVLYVFGQQPVDVDDCATKFTTLYPEKDTPIMLMCDVVYAHAMDPLLSTLKNQYNYTQLLHKPIKSDENLDRAPCAFSTTTGCACQSAASAGTDNTSGTQNHDHHEAANGNHSYATSRHADLPEGKRMEDYSLFYVGGESLTLTNILMVYNKCEVSSYDPVTKEVRAESSKVNRMLMKRYYLVQKARDADVVGIVVGTLAVSSYMDILNRLKKVLRKHGKRTYTFAMGKLNVAKLANFAEIDIYVLVACPENSLIDSKEFYRPVVTPWEMELAIGLHGGWTGEYVTAFGEVLRRDVQEDNDKEEESGDVSDEEPHFSLVTGRYKKDGIYTSTPRSTATQDDLSDDLKKLTIRNAPSDLALVLEGPGAAQLNSRQWRGLETKYEDHAPSAIQEGRSGIASGYVVGENTDQEKR
ncbi:hypothetical protein BZG36_03286 [Bifiguratus adelaidae]|uniref:2-(3-amino-3-carboxypropyl)histidine synthase subunit 2 n=1 Tax=Bifiguratus adelaidae TaxID=1938954 RepID=A0A261XZY4_9FUNG|nr:hypothetical protein BZG36_03286 [Bifiguratus adelaidae]